MSKTTAPEVLERAKEIKAKIISDIDGQTTYVDAGRRYLGSLLTEFGQESIADVMLLPLMIRDIKRDVDKRCIEKGREDQSDMFGSEFFDATVKVDESSFTRMGLANASLIRLIDERKLENRNRVNAAYDKWIARRDILLHECGMAADPTLTAEVAAQRYRVRG